MIGRQIDGTSGTYVDGLLAHVCIWEGDLTNPDTTDVAAYLNATSKADIEAIRSGAQLLYLPLDYDNTTQTNEWDTAQIPSVAMTNATYSSDDPFAGTNEGATGRGISRGVMRGVG